MKQLDVVVSPPAFIWNPYLTLTHVTFDHEFFSSNFFLVNYYLVTFGIVTDRRTDGKQRIRAHRALAQVGSKMQETDITAISSSIFRYLNFHPS